MLLTLAEPVEGGIEFVLVDVAEFENLAKTRRRRGGVEHAGGGELGGGREQAHHDHRHNEIATAIARRPENAVKADLTQGAKRGGDMTMREGAVHDDRLFADRARLPAFEKGAKPFDEFGRPVGEIEQCAFFDLTVLAIGFAQEDGGRRVPVGDGFDIHGRMIAPHQRSYNHKITNYMATFLRLKSEIPIEPQRLKRFRGWKFRLDGARRRRRFGHCSRQCPCPCR